jgi:hypothetical protein
MCTKAVELAVAVDGCSIFSLYFIPIHKQQGNGQEEDEEGQFEVLREQGGDPVCHAQKQFEGHFP